MDQPGYIDEPAIVEKFLGKKVASIFAYYGNFKAGERVLIIEANDEQALYDENDQYKGVVVKLERAAVSLSDLFGTVFEDWYSMGMIKIVAIGVVVTRQPNGRYLVAYQDKVLENMFNQLPF